MQWSGVDKSQHQDNYRFTLTYSIYLILYSIRYTGDGFSKLPSLYFSECLTYRIGSSGGDGKENEDQADSGDKEGVGGGGGGGDRSLHLSTAYYWVQLGAAQDN